MTGTVARPRVPPCQRLGKLHGLEIHFALNLTRRRDRKLEFRINYKRPIPRQLLRKFFATTGAAVLLALVATFFFGDRVGMFVFAAILGIANGSLVTKLLAKRSETGGDDVSSGSTL